MTQLLFANNAQSALAGSISNSATTLSVLPGGGALFPNPGAGQGFYATMTDAATGLVREIVLVTGRAGDTMTVIRAQQGTIGLNWLANDLFAKLWTAGDAQNYPQFADLQAQSANYAVDIGSVNAYACTLNPAISVPVPGMPIRCKILNTNTGASTFNPGTGVSAVKREDGSACIGGEMIAGGITTFVWDGVSAWQIGEPAQATVSAVINQVDALSFLSPANLVNAFSFQKAAGGWWIGGGPSAPQQRFIIEWSNTGVITSGLSGSATLPFTMAGGFYQAVVTPNFNVASGGGSFGYFGGGITGFTVVNQTPSNGAFSFIAIGIA
jgi:hypothetical protein